MDCAIRGSCEYVGPWRAGKGDRINRSYDDEYLLALARLGISQNVQLTIVGLERVNRPRRELFWGHEGVHRPQPKCFQVWSWRLKLEMELEGG